MPGLTQLSRDTSSLPVSLQDIKAHCRVTFADDDALLNAYILAACAIVEKESNKNLFPATYKLELNDWPILDKKNRQWIWLEKPPVLSITSFTYLNKDTKVFTPLTQNVDYYASLSGDYPHLEPYPLTYWPERSTLSQSDNIAILFSSGASVLPDEVVLAVKMLVAGMYQNREYGIDSSNYKELPGALAIDALISNFKRPVL